MRSFLADVERLWFAEDVAVEGTVEHDPPVETRELEEADRRGYERVAERADEMAAWDGAAVWPENVIRSAARSSG